MQDIPCNWQGPQSQEGREQGVWKALVYFQSFKAVRYRTNTHERGETQTNGTVCERASQSLCMRFQSHYRVQTCPCGTWPLHGLRSVPHKERKDEELTRALQYFHLGSVPAQQTSPFQGSRSWHRSHPSPSSSLG